MLSKAARILAAIIIITMGQWLRQQLGLWGDVAFCFSLAYAGMALVPRN
jgi:hypothetical protein